MSGMFHFNRRQCYKARFFLQSLEMDFLLLLSGIRVHLPQKKKKKVRLEQHANVEKYIGTARDVNVQGDWPASGWVLNWVSNFVLFEFLMGGRAGPGSTPRATERRVFFQRCLCPLSRPNSPLRLSPFS